MGNKFRRLRLLLGVLWLVILLFAMLTPGDQFPEVDYFDFQDKAIHFACFGLLSLIWSGVNYSSQDELSPKTIRLNYIIFGILMGVVLELGQLFVSFRTFDVYDILANELGGLAGFLTFLNIRRRK